MPKYKVSFILEGSSIADDIPLNKTNLKETLMMFNEEASYYGNRSIDTRIQQLRIVSI